MARPEIFKTALGQRLADVRKKLGYSERTNFAEKIGIQKETLGGYERGDREPTHDFLVLYRQRFGVDLTWLLTGEGDMFADQSKAPPPSTSVDPLLMEKLYKAVERVYKEVGQRPPGHRIANEATEVLNMLLERVTDVRDDLVVDAVIPALAEQLISRLREGAEEPGTGKLSA